MDNVTVVLPCLNEPYLSTLLEQLEDYHVQVQTEKGLSHAVWIGIHKAKDPNIVVMDADGSHPPEAIPRMINILSSRICLVVGSRYCEGGYSYDSLIRKIVSHVYCLIARVVLRTNMSDPMSGFWVGYKEAFQFDPSENYKFGLQLIRNNQGHIQEYPIIFKKRKMGKSHIKPTQAINDLLNILRSGVLGRKRKNNSCF